jgi:choline dehydrogenase-like flavoprotein
MQGTNKMGSNPRSSVVSKNFKVWNQATDLEIDNLYVIDSSIFPTSIGANPMQSIYIFAKIFVDRYLKRGS